MFDFLQTGIKKYYDVDKDGKLGEGKFAVVRHAKRKKDSVEVAVKVIQKNKCKSDQSRLQEEIDIMKKVKHPNCIEFIEMFESRNKIYIVMELVTGGELFDRIVQKDHYSEQEAADTFYQLISAVQYLHSLGIVHRDIKPENILYASPKDDAPIKLADFGLGKMIDVHGIEDEHSMMHTFCGTPTYLAPEVIKRHGYGQECDVWSVGVILYILLCGCPPFGQNVSMPVLFNRITRASYGFPDPFWKGISMESRELIKNMMEKDPKKRFSPQQCMEHVWVKQYHDKQLSSQSLGKAQSRLKEWNVARKLKGAIMTFQALHKLRGTGNLNRPSKEEEPAILKEVREDKERFEELRTAFQMLDKGKTGKISMPDLKQALKDIGASAQYTDEDLQHMIERFDIHETGQVDFEEFCVMMGPASPEPLHRQKSKDLVLQEAFSFFDVDKSGGISPEELFTRLRKLGATVTDEEVNSMLKLADTDNDGSINMTEFQAIWQRHFIPPAIEEESEEDVSYHKQLAN